MPNQILEQAVFAALPGTVPEIMKKSGVSSRTVYEWIKTFREQGRIHIATWRRNGYLRPYYAAGHGVDKPRPKAFTKATIDRRYYRKHVRDLEKEIRASGRAARKNAASTRKAPQSWISALGGC